MGKIVTKQQFKEIKSTLKSENKKIVLCHGVFDLVHPGHILHFEEAKKLGDVLVVSVTAAQYVRKGPGRPYFGDELRLKFLSEIECIDYVILSEGFTVNDIIEVVEPDWYVKGKEYEKASDDLTGKISEEVELVRQHGGDVYYTSGEEVFSSTKLINDALGGLSPEIRAYSIEFQKKYSMSQIKKYTEEIKNKKILVVGDAIIDEYVFCNVQGLMSKDNGYSARYVKEEQYLGGSLAIARHLASFCDNVTISAVVGTEEAFHSRFLNELSGDMRVDMVYSDKFETIVKKRYIMQNAKREEINKLFVINNLKTPMEIDKEAMDKFKEKLRKKIEGYDTVILCDFGHGLIDNEVMDIIQEKAKFLSLNCQTNSSNYGTNLITKYHRADSFVLDEKELKLAFSDYKSSPDDSLMKLSEHLNCSGWLTQGAIGATLIENGKFISCPAFTLKVKDTIGAGDAFFAVASAYAAVGAPREIGTFMGNIAGALAANIVGNKEAIEKVNVLKYASTLLNV